MSRSHNAPTAPPTAADERRNERNFTLFIISTSFHLPYNCEKLYGYIEKNLTEREKLIIRLRYGVSEGKGTPEHPEITQREIAKQLGISRSYVSRIEKKALQKLRRAYDYGRRKN